MYVLECDRPPFIRISGEVAGPLESFGSIAHKFGADAAELKKFNGGEVYASRTIYVP